MLYDDDFTTYTTSRSTTDENPITFEDLVAALDILKAQRPPDWIDGLIVSKLVKPGEYWRKEDTKGVPYGMLHPTEWIRQMWSLRRMESVGMLGTGFGIPVYESDEMAARLMAGLPLREIAGLPVILDESLKPGDWFIKP